jgi:spore photoproduct lyase
MNDYTIRSILIARHVLHHPYVEHILNQFPTSRIEIIDSEKVDSLSLPWIRSKQTMLLTTFPGSFIKDCPATGHPYRCCRYRILSPVVGCPIDCSYCILQHYVGQRPITVYVNWDDLFPQVQKYLEDFPGCMVRIGSGELADSLALEPALGMAKTWIPFFATLPNAVLELKTKTAEVDWLKPIPHGGRTVIAWSLNPPEIAAENERFADMVEQRITAAAKVVSWGYKVAFHFDPILTIPGWDQMYRSLVQVLCHQVPAQTVSWVSLGSLRFPLPLRHIVRRRFPNSDILSGEWIRGMDGKSRLIKPLRIKMFKKVYQWLREGWGDQVYIYLCMESGDVWRESLGWEPKSRDEVERMFQVYWENKYLERFGSKEKVVDFK